MVYYFRTKRTSVGSCITMLFLDHIIVCKLNDLFIRVVLIYLNFHVLRLFYLKSSNCCKVSSLSFGRRIKFTLYLEHLLMSFIVLFPFISQLVHFLLLKHILDLVLRLYVMLELL